MELLLAHLVGDYLIQSDWMAQNKRQSTAAAAAHAATYTLPFLVLFQAPAALAFVCGTHFLIDRFGLARYVVFAKNRLAPSSGWDTWAETDATGYNADRPAWLRTWLFIIADNTMHLACNAAAAVWLVGA